jgi:hypothetical protein
MALYKETYRLSNNFPGFTVLKEKLDFSTGLKNEIEILSEQSIVIFNEKFKTTIEVTLESEESDIMISLFFAPRKKNYIEWSLINVLNEYLVTPNRQIPNHVKKKWQELNFIEKHFK